MTFRKYLVPLGAVAIKPINHRLASDESMYVQLPDIEFNFDSAPDPSVP